MDTNYDIGLVRAGNKVEFGKMVDDNMHSVYITAMRIIADEEDARDIAQETFIKVWEKRKSIRDGNSFSSYLKRITVNKCYDLLRKRRTRYNTGAYFHENRSVINEIASCDSADLKLTNEETRSVLNILTEKLSPRQRVIFALVEIEELSHEEVAALTGMKKTAIKSNLSHAKKKMGTLIKQYLNG